MVREGDVLERGGWQGIVIEVEGDLAMLAFAPKVGGFPRPNERVDPKEWKVVSHAVQAGCNTISK